MTSYVTHLKSTIGGSRYPADQLQKTHDGRPFWVRSDLPKIGQALA